MLAKIVYLSNKYRWYENSIRNWVGSWLFGYWSKRATRGIEIINLYGVI